MILGAYYLTYGPEADELAKIDRATHDPRRMCSARRRGRTSYEAGVVKLHELAEFRPMGARAATC